MAEPKHILLLDDDDDFRAAARDFLLGGGYRVTEVADGQEAIQLCERDPPDLLITDMSMPRTPGYEVILALRKRYPTLKILAMSGGGRVEAQDYLELARSVGADRTVGKPFHGRTLVRAVLELLGD